MAPLVRCIGFLRYLEVKRFLAAAIAQLYD